MVTYLHDILRMHGTMNIKLPFNLSRSLQSEFVAMASLEEGNFLKSGQYDTKKSLIGSEWKYTTTVVKLGHGMDKISKSYKSLINFNSSLRQCA